MDDRAHACSISLFSGGGIGDLGIQYGASLPVIACSEIVASRARLLRSFYPTADVHEGDLRITKSALVDGVKERLRGGRPFLIVMSPPCQGMSSNGAGRIGAAVKTGGRPPIDERNRLILPALEVVDALAPDVVVLENVRRMETTTIPNERGQPENAITLFKRRLAQYRVEIKVLDFSSLGVPQRRIRLIGIATRDARPAHIPLHPTTNYPPVSLREATGHLTALDARSKLVDADDPYHSIPRWNEHQYFCMQHTPENATAFDNTICVSCQHQNTERDACCTQCGSILPRPSIVKRRRICICCGDVVEKECGKCATGVVEEVYRRPVRAFRTAYRRMDANRPASTLTTNSGVISSDLKGHPRQHRVLSVREVMIVASVCSRPNFCAPWWEKVEPVFATLSHSDIRSVLGESIPPLALSVLVRHLIATRTHPLEPSQ